ncbi:exodeoxyribonuclease VII large subunit [Desulfovibrionales bacterium]
MHIFTVQTLTQAVKDVLEGEFPFVWVRGQITNLSRPPSGHFYFSLKDTDALLQVVWFKGAQPRVDQDERINPLTGEVESGPVLALADGLEVLVAGRVNVYPQRGSYQLVAELVQTQGQGELAIAFEALKAKLAAKGYFDADRKLSLPANPTRVAVITAPQGAALQDFLRIAETRGYGATIRLYPSLMQGDGAPAQIAAALDQADADNWAEVIVLIRGGGSLEDLWAFNTETVADALYRVRVPVVTGVGHEVDTTIADFIADQRAATPSHAAQIVWTERDILKQQFDDAFMAMHHAMNRFCAGKHEHLTRLHQAVLWHSPAQRIERTVLTLEALAVRLRHALHDAIQQQERNLDQARQGLTQNFGPLTIAQIQAQVQQLRTALHRAGTLFIQARFAALGDAHTVLARLDPHAPLARGYAFVQDGQGRGIRSCAEVRPGDVLQVQVHDGAFAVEVLPCSDW